MHKNQEQMHLPYAQRSAIIAFMQKDQSRSVLQRLIMASGERATEVARKAGVPQSTLSRILTGKIESPSDRQISRLAEYFGVSSDQIRGRAPLPAEKIDPEDLPGALRVRQLRENWASRHAEPVKAGAKAEDDMCFIGTEIIDEDEPLRPDEVRLPLFREVEFSAGDGATEVIENHGAHERFSLARLSKAGVQPQNAALAVAKGDSMMPAIHDGATLGIDKGCRHAIDGKIFALDHGGMLRVKRLYRLPLNRIRVVSENSDEYPEEIYSVNDPDAPRILGRVFWWENFD